MGLPNPEETGAVPNPQAWAPQQPEGRAWSAPHQDSDPNAHPIKDRLENSERPPENRPSPPPTPGVPQSFSDHSSSGRSSHEQPDQNYPSQPYPQQAYSGPGGGGQGASGAYAPYPSQGYPPQAGPGQPYANQHLGQFAQQPYQGGPWVSPLRSDYAHWGRRVGAFLVDFAPSYVGLAFIYTWYFQFIVQLVGAARSESFPKIDLTSPLLIIGVVISFLGYAYTIWNRYLLDGRRGQSLGKRVFRIKLISEATGEPTGALNAFLRDLLHTLDGMACVGYLWPLWDDKRQTFADKLMHTIVVTAPNAATNSNPDAGQKQADYSC